MSARERRRRRPLEEEDIEPPPPPRARAGRRLRRQRSALARGEDRRRSRAVHAASHDGAVARDRRSTRRHHQSRLVSESEQAAPSPAAAPQRRCRHADGLPAAEPPPPRGHEIRVARGRRLRACCCSRSRPFITIATTSRRIRASTRRSRALREARRSARASLGPHLLRRASARRLHRRRNQGPAPGAREPEERSRRSRCRCRCCASSCRIVMAIASRRAMSRRAVMCPAPCPRTRMLGAGQRLDAEMTFDDPGQQAVGFEIDACLPAPDKPHPLRERRSRPPADARSLAHGTCASVLTCCPRTLCSRRWPA